MTVALLSWLTQEKNQTEIKINRYIKVNDVSNFILRQTWNLKRFRLLLLHITLFCVLFVRTYDITDSCRGT